MADGALAETGRARIGWAERAMPVLRGIARRFAEKRPLVGVRIAACLHVTPETAHLLRALAAGGAEVSLAASNPLSTQDDVAAALVQDGVAVFAKAGVDRAGYYAHIERALDIEPHYVLDDGCDLVNTLHTRRAELLDGVRAGCEQTTTGVLRLREMARSGVLRFPVVAVNDTEAKRLVDNRYGTGQSSVEAIVRATNLLLAGRTVVVAGYGAGGRGVAARAGGMGARLIITEVDPIRALEASLDGYQVLPMAEAVPLGDVFVTVTGNRDVITVELAETMADGAVLANAGHFDVEIDVRGLRAAASSVRRVRQHVEELTLASGRRVLLLAEGRVVNLAAAEGNPPEVMDVAFAEQALTVEWLAGGDARLDPGVHDVPPEIDRTVAELTLGARGVRLDRLSDAQAAYLSSWQFGS